MSLELARRVLEIEARAVGALAERLDEHFNQAVEALMSCAGFRGIGTDRAVSCRNKT